MSMFEVRTFLPNGTQDKILPGVVAEFTDDFGASGYVKVSIPHHSPAAGMLAHETEVALFIEGVEVDNSRALIREHTGNESSGDDGPGEAYAEVWGGKTLWARLDEAIVYPELWPAVTKMFHSFGAATPGTIMKTLITRAQARGALDEIDHATWTGAVDANGQGWAQNNITISYDAGVTLLSVAENLQRLGVMESRMVGRSLRLFNPDTVGVDRTIGANPIVLRRGKQVTDTPFSESSDKIRNALLVIGEEGVAFEKQDASSVSAHGRRESALSQGGTGDLGTLNVLGDSSLVRSAGIRGEYTCKILIGAPGEQPFVDFKTGDWVWLDRIGQLFRYRVRQMSVTQEESVWFCTVTLNDKFNELDLETAKKVEGILGGASSDTVRPPKPPSDVDSTTPKPPTGVATSGDVYTNGAGQVLATAQVNWTPPTENTDNTALDDLAGFETEIQTDGSVVYGPPVATIPARLDDQARILFNRRKKSTNGWLGGDNGSNIRAADGKDWFFWADTIWGKTDSKGKVLTGWRMPRNSITVSSTADSANLPSFFGSQNLLPDSLSQCESTAGWTYSNCAIATDGWKRGGVGSIQLTRSAAGAMRSYTSVVAASPGLKYRGMTQFDATSTATARTVELWFYNAASTFISVGGTAAAGADGRASVLSTAAPAGTAYVRLHVVSATGAAGETLRYTQAGIMQTDHELASWRLNEAGLAADLPTTLMVSSDVGGVAGEFLWSADAFVIGGTAYAFFQGQVSTGGGEWDFASTGKVYLAKWDTATKRLLQFDLWASTAFSWGNAAVIDGSFLYVLGHKTTGAYVYQNYLMRVPTANPFGGTKEYWNGTAWVGTEASAANIVTAQSSLSGLRKVGTSWIALYSPFYDTYLRQATASALTGTWTVDIPVFKYPEPSGNTGSQTFKYLPRFVPQWDSNTGGMSFLYCQNGDGLGNNLNYVPRFLRGPAGTASASASPTGWRDRQATTTAPALFSNLMPGTVFAARTAQSTTAATRRRGLKQHQ